MADGGVGLPGDAAARMRAGVSVYSAELAWAICARISAGESLRAVCLRHGMPHRTTVRNWADTKPEFAEALAAAQRSRRIAWRLRDRSKEEARRARLGPMRGGRPSAYTPELGMEICFRMMNGESVVGIGRDPEMPCAGAIYRWVQRHPHFEEIYGKARELQGDYLFDEVREVALEVTTETVSADRLRFDIARWQTARLAPKKYAERLVVAAELAQQKAELAAEAGQPAVVQMLVTRFERSPKDPKKMIAWPPRNEAEAAAYEEAFGEPYAGPGPIAPEDDWRLQQTHHARRERVKAELRGDQG